MLAMLCLKATATMAAVIHFNTAEEADAALKSPLYPKLMVLVYSDDMDMPQRLFAEAEEMWRKNVTFAQTAFYAHSKLVGEIGAMPDKLPAYALLMRGLPRAVPHTGAWTAAGISNFLSYQLHDFRASSLHRSSTTFTASKLANYARQRPFKSVVFAFVTTSRQESEVAHAARSAGVRLYVRFVNESVAEAVGAPCPSVVVVHGGADPNTETAWPVFKPHYDHGSYFWTGLEIFLTERAMPPLVPLGDSEAHFGAALRKARYQITIYLCHNQRGRWASLRLDEDAARAVSSASSRAMETFAAVAPAFEGVAAFIGLDWFDNPPDLIQFVAGAGATEESLPFAVAVPSRLGQHDDQPRGHMLRGSALQQEEAVRRFVDDAIAKQGLLGRPPPDYQSWRPLAAGVEAKEEL